MTLQIKLLLIIAVVLSLTFMGIELLNYHTLKTDIETDLRQQAERIRNLLMSMRRVGQKKFLASALPLNDKTLGLLPAHIMSEISQDYYNWDNSGFNFENVSDQPRNLAHAADAMELEAMRHFRQHPEQEVLFKPFTQSNGELFFFYARPIWIEQYCLKCHGKRSDAPSTIQELYSTGYDYQVGDLRGLLSIKIPATSVKERLWKTFWRGFLIHLAGFLMIFLFIILLIYHHLTHPLEELCRVMHSVTTTGYYTHRVKDFKGEFAILGNAFNLMIEKISTHQTTLQSLNHALDQKVKQRTADLEQANLTIQKNQERFELAMRGTNDGLWDWDVKTGEVYYSPRWKNMLGYADDEIESHINEVIQRIHPEDWILTQDAIYAYLSKKTPHYELIFRMRHQLGHYVWILSRAFAVWDDEQGTIKRIVGTHVDITAQKQVEEELRQAKETAEVANRAKNLFLANVTHELRTPLSCILGFSQVLSREENLLPHQRESLEIIQRNGDYLLNIINDILDLAKIEAGQGELCPRDFNFLQWLGYLLQQFQEQAQSKAIHFIYEIVSPLPQIVYADDKRLQKIIRNLLGNAIKFTEHGQVILKINYVQSSATICFQIEDTGPGIDSPALENLFLSFHQLRRVTHKSQGAGLGLTMTKKLVDMMKGELRVESYVGQGSTFWVNLGLPKCSNDFLQEKVMGHKKILVIDEESYLEFNYSLTALGFQVKKLHHIELEQVKAWQPDLIFIDFSSPKLKNLVTQIQNIPMLDILKVQVNHHMMLISPTLQELVETLHSYVIKNECSSDEEQEKIDLPFLPPQKTFPSQEALTLFELAQMGDVMGVIEYLEYLEEGTLQGLPLLNNLRKLANNFDLEKICEMVKPYTSHPI